MSRGKSGRDEPKKKETEVIREDMKIYIYMGKWFVVQEGVDGKITVPWSIKER